MSTTTKEPKTATEELEEQYEAAAGSPGCGILGRYPVISVVSFAAIGLGMGLGLSFWEPEDPDTKAKLLKWVGLVGDLFIRSLRCVVLPLIFVNVVMAVVDMMRVGKAGSVGWKALLLYLISTVFASAVGVVSILIYKGLFKVGDFEESGPAMVSLGCNAEDSFLAEMMDGTLMCTSEYMEGDKNIEFKIVDITGTFVTASGGVSDEISLSDTVYDGVFTKLVTSNITEAFVEANFAAVVLFACVFGVGLSRVLDKKKDAQGINFILELFKELDGVLVTLINWIITITPFAVLSLITNAVGSQDDLEDAFANVGYLVAAVMTGMAFHVLVYHCGVFFLITKTNPFVYMRFLAPAQTMAFACASSAATIPMTLKSVRASGRVPDSIMRFVVPLGATVNMDGSAIYFPCACIWLAVLNDIEINASHFILLVIISTIGSAGTAPVPSAGLVLVITAYNTVFNTTGTPDGFPFIVAIDWFLDRLQTVVNVTGDGIVCGMVAHLCPLDETEEVLCEVSKAGNEDISSEELSDKQDGKELAA
jgi:solute carrier family 1 (neutral amino acid transporter) protein 5